MTQLDPFSTFNLTERAGGPGALRRIAYPFRASLAPTVFVKLEQKVPRDGTIESMRVRVYAGNQLSLHIVPYVINARQERRDLVAWVKGGKQWLDGDDDQFVFSIREPVFTNDNDVITVEVTNTDAVNTYNFAVDIEVDFAAGPWPLMVIAGNGGEV